MTVWLENPFDNLPAEGRPAQRYVRLARALAASGHAVTLFTSDFSHALKCRRAFTQPPESAFRLVLVPTKPYRRNVSLARLASHRAYARAFADVARREAAAQGRPDLLLVSLPPLATGDAARALAREFACRLVIDIQDAWPETFYRLLPRPLRFCGRLLFAPAHAAARRVLRAADAVTGVAERYRALARGYGVADYRLFRLGADFPAHVPSRPVPVPPRLVYAGNLGRGYDLGTVIRALDLLPGATLDVAGAGECAARWRRLAADNPRVRFHGYLNAAELSVLLDGATVGVIPMRDDSAVGLPNKLGDYLAHGLRVVTSLGGECAALVAAHAAGASYAAGDPASLAAAVRSACAAAPDFAALRDELDAAAIYPAFAAFLEGPMNRPLSGRPEPRVAGHC